MTKEQAIEYIKAHCNPDYPNGKTEWEVAMNMAIEALEKEVPQKPIKSTDNFDDNLLKLYCPTCSGYIAHGNKRVGTLNKFTVSDIRCGYCGQMIDWSGWDENTGSD